MSECFIIDPLCGEQAAVRIRIECPRCGIDLVKEICAEHYAIYSNEQTECGHCWNVDREVIMLVFSEPVAL